MPSCSAPPCWAGMRPPSPACSTACSAALLIGLVTTASMLAAGLDVAGSVTYGAGLTLLGLCYAAVSLVAAQLSTSARGALGLAGAAIAIGYLVRGVGAMQDNALVWASPFGWAQRDGRLRRRAVVAGPAARGADRRAARRWRPGSPRTATSVAACCSRARAGRVPRGSSARRSGWPCACSAGC